MIKKTSYMMMVLVMVLTMVGCGLEAQTTVSADSATETVETIETTEEAATVTETKTDTKAEEHTTKDVASDETKVAETTEETKVEEIPKVPDTPEETVDAKVNPKEEVVFNSIEGISRIGGLTAKCENDFSACVVDADADPSVANPYDVAYEYGDLYEEYVNACDWSLIFDAEYYKTLSLCWQCCTITTTPFCSDIFRQ